MPFWPRLWFSLRPVAAWAAALGLLLASSALSDWVAFDAWLIMFLGASSLPLVGLGAVICFAFPRYLAAHRSLAALAAVVIGVVFGFALAGGLGLLSLVVSVPAACLFLLSTYRWQWRVPGPDSG